jgi:hypothetical protein
LFTNHDWSTIMSITDLYKMYTLIAVIDHKPWSINISSPSQTIIQNVFIDCYIWLINNHVYHKLLYKMYTLIAVIDHKPWSITISPPSQNIIQNVYTDWSQTMIDQQSCLSYKMYTLIAMIDHKLLYKRYRLIAMIDQPIMSITNTMIQNVYIDCYDWSQIMIEQPIMYITKYYIKCICFEIYIFFFKLISKYSSPPLIRPLPPKATPLIRPDIKCSEIVNSTKLSPPPGETTPLIRPLVHCRRGLLYWDVIYPLSMYTNSDIIWLKS